MHLYKSSQCKKYTRVAISYSCIEAVSVKKHAVGEYRRERKRLKLPEKRVETSACCCPIFKNIGDSNLALDFTTFSMFSKQVMVLVTEYSMKNGYILNDIPADYSHLLCVCYVTYVI